MPNLANKLSARSSKIHRHAVSLSHAMKDFRTYAEGVATGERFPKVRKGIKHTKKAQMKNVVRLLAEDRKVKLTTPMQRIHDEIRKPITLADL